MLLKNILDKVVTCFVDPVSKPEAFGNDHISRFLSLFTAIVYSSKASDIAIFLSNCKQPSLYSLIPLLVEESQRNHACSRWKSQSRTLLSEKKNNVKHRNINRKWIEKKKKSGAWHHQSFKIKYLKLEWPICIPVFLYFSRFERNDWNNELIQCHHEGTMHSWLHVVPYHYIKL